MKKRQRKKIQKRYFPIYGDEANLLTMTEEEQKKAWNDYLKFREKHTYCKTYRRVKEFYKENKLKMIFYQFPVGEKMSNYLQEISNIGRRQPRYTATQSLTEEEKQKLLKALKEN